MAAMSRALSTFAEDLGLELCLAPETPPPIVPPAPRRPSAFAGGPNRLLRELRADYGCGAVTDEGRALGDRPEVVAWLESLGTIRFGPATSDKWNGPREDSV
jgi:hypothetical protein